MNFLRLVVLAFLIFGFFSVQAQKTKEERLRELEALEGELEDIKRSDELKKLAEIKRDKADSISALLYDQLLNYQKSLFNGDLSSLKNNMDSMKLLLNSPFANPCYTISQLAVNYLCDFYTQEGNQREYQKTISLLPDSCGFMVKEYIETTNLITAGRMEEAKKIIDQAEYKVPDECLTGNELSNDCYGYISLNIIPDIAARYLANVMVVLNHFGQTEKAINYGKTGLAFVKHAGRQEEAFVAALSLASVYFASNQIDKVLTTIQPYEDMVETIPWMYQKEYNRLMSAVAANKGDEEERERYTNKMEHISSENKDMRTLEDRIDDAFEAFQFQDVGSVMGIEGFEGKNSLETLVEEMEARHEYNSIYYMKAILMLAASYENSMSLQNFHDPERFLIDKLSNINSSKSLGIIYFYLGNKKYDEIDFQAFEYLENAMVHFKESGDQLGAFQARQMLAFLYDMYEMPEEALGYYMAAIENAGLLIKDYYPFLTEKEQYQFNQRWIQQLENSAFSFFARQPESVQQQLIGGLLKFRLQTKGLLLQNSASRQLAIISSDNKGLKSDFDKITQLKQQLSMNQEVISWEEKKQLINDIENLEEKISTELGTSNVKKNNLFNISDIQEKLGKNEYAVEIVRTQVGTGKFLSDTVNYTFFIIPSSGNIKVAFARDSRNLEERDFSFYSKAIQFKIEDDQSYKNYWSILDKEIPEDAAVFISTDGIYNAVSLASLYDADNEQYLYEINDIIQLSSLRDILDQQNKKMILSNKSIFIGRPKYYLKGSDESSEDRGAMMADLPGTEKEVEVITSRLAATHLSFEKHLGEDAIESVVKQVDAPGILHIATHGYFKRSEEKEDDFFNDPMLSAGLLLTGAGDSSSPDGEDGILTAYEITSMNLSNTDLVVLSACESGVGESRDGQGVYGLTRAFFVAGSDAVISTLWKVDDNATQKFMELFYSEWLKDNNLRNAINFARSELRKEYPQPYYWAAFTATGI
ncbi:MAG: CHAT domain-containing protein [Candidatus Cyclobacteriaceae bacterium M2_1C_046]